MLEIITNNDLTRDQLKILDNFNTLYTKWVDSIINGYTFIEMQSKLLTLQQFIMGSIKKNTGFLQLCKMLPKVRLRYTADEDNAINIIDPNVYENMESENDDDNDEIMELREMVLNCVSLYASFFEQSDFENLGGSLSRIIENTDKLEQHQRELYEYKDIECIFE